MTDEEAAAELRRIEEEADGTQAAHIEGDALLCRLLKELGYHETVEAFEELSKWYS